MPTSRTLPAVIAWRYLLKRKSTGALSLIAAVAVAGVAVATAAVICVLSVFNGFRDVLITRSNQLLPDIEVVPESGKTIIDADSLAAAIGRLADVAVSTPIIADQALAISGQRETPVILRGIDPAAFRQTTSIDSLLIAGSTIEANAAPQGQGHWVGDVFVEDEPIPQALASVGLATRLQAYQPGATIFLFVPRKGANINPANPAASFITDSVCMNGVFESRQEDYDENSLFLPITTARRLLQYHTEASAIHVTLHNGSNIASAIKRLQQILPPGLKISDRERMQTENYRMVEIEKWITGLLLSFILLIASFNIVSAMTMFVIEKQKSLKILHSLGMPRRTIGWIFGWESFFVTTLGALAGTIMGILLCLGQMHWGWIKLQATAPGVDPIPYPVRIHWPDLLAVWVPVLLICLLTSWTAASFAKRRINPNLSPQARESAD